MTSKDNHSKHPKLVRKSTGHFHHAEMGIYGTNCGKIADFYQSLSEKIIERTPGLKVMYIDATHDDSKRQFLIQHDKKMIHSTSSMDWNTFDDKLYTETADLVFVNGNHYPADNQIVILDASKKDSLERRKDQLTNIKLVILPDENFEIFPFVKSKMNEETQICMSSDWDTILSMANNIYNSGVSNVKALILAGGKSTRMREDKSQISYGDDKPQQEKVADMCASFGLDVYISKAYDYKDAKLGGYPVIKDRFVDLGPFGAICTAMLTDPKSAWLVIACDLPLLTKDYITELLEKRNPTVFATAFRISENPFPEPLITIYEPKAYRRFLDFLSLGYSCPRKVLINSQIETIEIENGKSLMNANTQEEKLKAEQLIKRK